jgi:hypothetical protein
MKQEKEKCSICGKLKPLLELGEYWRGAGFMQQYPGISCHDEKNCKSLTDEKNNKLCQP